MWIVTVEYDEEDGISGLPRLECNPLSDITWVESSPPLLSVYLFSHQDRALEFMQTIATGIRLHHEYVRSANARASRLSRQRQRERIAQAKARREQDFKL
jgi:hypothetical protein